MIEALVHLAGHHLFHHLCEGSSGSKGRKLVYGNAKNPNASDRMSLYEAKVDIQKVRQHVLDRGKWIDNISQWSTVGELIGIVDSKL